MINATEAKLLTEEVKVNNAKEWYKDFSTKLNEEIIKQINCGCYILIIDKNHKLNDYDWINCESLRNKAKRELELLGYKFSFSGAGTGIIIEIDWS